MAKKHVTNANKAAIAKAKKMFTQQSTSPNDKDSLTQQCPQIEPTQEQEAPKRGRGRPRKVN